MAINMLNTNLDLDIEDYVTVDFGAISDVIDLLGGVEITLEEEEIEPFNKYVTETARVAGKEAHQISEPGTYLMDGPQATTYARIRSTAGGDFTRTERQRLVIEKAVEKIQKADLLTINSIINEVFPQISTSFTLQEILYYAQAYSQYELLENTGFPFDQSTDNISGLGSVVIAEDLTSNVKQLHEFLFGVTDYTPSSIVTANNEGIIAATGYSSGYVTDYDVYDGGYAGDSDESYNDYDSYDSYSYGGYEDETYSRDDWEDEESYGNTETYEDGYDSSQDEEQWSSGGETGTGEDSGSGDGYGESEVSSDSQEE